jgi:hypothetical protein
MLGIHPDHRQHEVKIFRLLMESLEDFGKRITEAGTVVSAIYANGFTKEGENLCRSLGLEPIAKSVQGGDVFRTTNVQGSLARLARLARRRKLLTKKKQ